MTARMAQDSTVLSTWDINGVINGICIAWNGKQHRDNHGFKCRGFYTNRWGRLLFHWARTIDQYEIIDQTAMVIAHPSHQYPHHHHY